MKYYGEPLRKTWVSPRSCLAILWFTILRITAVNEAVKAYKKLKEKGKMVNELDVLIAGIAAANNETLITKDKQFVNSKSAKIIVL